MLSKLVGREFCVESDTFACYFHSNVSLLACCYLFVPALLCTKTSLLCLVGRLVFAPFVSLYAPEDYNALSEPEQMMEVGEPSLTPWANAQEQEGDVDDAMSVFD